MEILSAEDFYRPAHQTVFAALAALRRGQAAVDLVSLKGSLGGSGKLEAVGGVEYLLALVEGVSHSAHLEHHAKTVKDHSIRRSVIRLGTDSIRRAYDQEDTGPLLGWLQQRIYELSALDDPGRASTAAEAGQRVLTRCEAVERGDIPSGVQTGFGRIDAVTGGGLQPGELVVIAAATSVGKSSLASCQVANVANSGGRALVFSVEMTSEEIAQRMLQAIARVNGLKIRAGKLRVDEWTLLMEAQHILETWGDRIILVDRPMPVAEMVAMAREYGGRSGKPLNLVVIDYLQILPFDKGATLREQINYVTAACKRAASSLRVPIVLLSQLNRSSLRDNKPPEAHHLKESGDIENNANTIILLYEPEGTEVDPATESKLIWCKVAKSRNGVRTTWTGEDRIRLRFWPAYTEFKDVGDK